MLVWFILFVCFFRLPSHPLLLPFPSCLPLLLQQAANSSRAAGPGAAESPETPTAAPPADGGGTPQGPGTSPASSARPATLLKRVSVFVVFTRIRFFPPSLTSLGFLLLVGLIVLRFCCRAFTLVLVLLFVLMLRAIHIPLLICCVCVFFFFPFLLLYMIYTRVYTILFVFFFCLFLLFHFFLYLVALLCQVIFAKPTRCPKNTCTPPMFPRLI